jgi:hypothetical protein
MADKPDQEQEPTQRTPKGLKIPLPKRERVMRDFRKVFKPDESESNEDKSPIVDDGPA